MDELKSKLSTAHTPRARCNWKQWGLACASSVLSLSLADAVRAQEPPPATAPSGITTIEPSAPPAVVPPSLPVAPPPPPPAIVLIEPHRDGTAEVAVIAPPPALTPPPPSTPAWSPVYTGSFFTRYELRSGYDDLGIASATSRPRFDDGDSIYYRMRLGIGTGLIDVGNGLKVALQFTPQATGVFGNLTNSPASPNTNIDANLGIHEGYTRVQGKHTRFDAGRFEMNYGDALMLGNQDWNEIARSFDGVRARFSANSADPTLPWVDVFATVLDEGRPDTFRNYPNDQLPGIGQGDVYLTGIYGALGPAITKGLDLDLYSFVRSWGPAKGFHTVSGNAMSPTWDRESAAEATFGGRAKQKVKWFDYRSEVGLQAGSRPGAAPAATATAPVAKIKSTDVLAYQADLELGASMFGDKYRVSLEGLYASGDKAKTKGKSEGWDELYPTAHKWLGLSDAWAQGGQKRTNTASGVLHLTANPIKPLTFQVDGHLLARPEKSAQFYNHRGLSAGEVDIAMVYMLAKGL
ncbi:MAG: hypothetical protein JWN04_2985, partial [Myxococcaceae bacterium]|nr:hypothetical protein [Myxococcaceae bacterium]